MGLIGAALPMTVSRSAVLAVLAVAFILLPTWPKLGRRIAYVVMALGVAGLWMLVPGLIRRFRTLFATLTGDTSTTSRTSAFSTAMPYISQHPWFGHGFGTFFPATYFFTDDQYLLSLIEIGVVGLFALLALFVTGLVTAQRVRRATNDPEMRDLGQCLTATIAVAMVAFGSFDALSYNMAAGLTFLFLGCTGAALRLLKAQGVQADGHLAGQLAMQPDRGPAGPHAPAPARRAGWARLGGRAGRAGRTSAPGRSPTGDLPPPAEQQLEQPAGPRQEEEAGRGWRSWSAGTWESAPTASRRRQADLHPATPAEANSQRSRPGRRRSSRPSPTGRISSGPGSQQDLQPAETGQEEQAAETRQEVPAQMEQPSRGRAPAGQAQAETKAEAPGGAGPEGAGPEREHGGARRSKPAPRSAGGTA